MPVSPWGALVESAQTYAGRRGTRAASRPKSGSDARVNLRNVSTGLHWSRRGVAALDEAVKVSMSVNDPARLALTQMLATGFRLVFDSWRPNAC